MRHYIPGVTPSGVLLSPYLNEPDTEGKYADGKYKTQLLLSDSDTAAFTSLLSAHAKTLLPCIRSARLPIKFERPSGRTSFLFKSTKQPTVTDCALNIVPNSVPLRIGTRVRLVYTLTNYDKGLSLWLDAVQVVALAPHSDALSLLSPVEGGYVFDHST